MTDDGYQKRGGYISGDDEMVIPVVPDGAAPGAMSDEVTLPFAPPSQLWKCHRLIAEQYVELESLRGRLQEATDGAVIAAAARDNAREISLNVATEAESLRAVLGQIRTLCDEASR